MYHIRTAILVEHLEHDRCAILEYGLDLIGVFVSLSCFVECGSNVSGGSEVGGGPDAEDIFNRADGLDEVLLDCWMILELESE